jgi:hypothetical protein
LPGGAHAGERRRQLTQNIDIAPTLCEYYQVTIPHAIHGKSWKDILEKDSPSLRDAALYGWFGQTVNVTDGHCTYFRAPESDENTPLYRYFLTPGTFSMRDVCHESFYDSAELGPFLPYTDYPVIRSKAHKRRSQDWAETMLYNLEFDYAQCTNLAGTDREQAYVSLLLRTMKAMDAPSWQYQRLGLEAE